MLSKSADSYTLPVIKGFVFSLSKADGAARLHIAWSTFGVRKDIVQVGLYGILWLLFAPSAVFITYKALIVGISGYATAPFGMICQVCSLCTFVACAWGVAIWLSYQWLMIFSREWIEVSPYTVTHGVKGLIWNQVLVLPVRQVAMLAAGHFSSESGDFESCITLNIIYTEGYGGISRIRCGDWIAPDIKLDLLGAIRDFLLHFDIQIKCEMRSPRLL